jgi:hypothetical protein
MIRLALILSGTLFGVVFSPHAYAWNALGHKVISEVAWQRLSSGYRQEIVRTLRRHPRYDEDFANRLGSDGPEDQLVFLHASTWPDIARGIRGEARGRFDQGTWHYVNEVYVIDGFSPASLPNLELRIGEQDSAPRNWNVSQAFQACLDTLSSDATPSAKALAYCWLFHLVGDIHQPMHSTALFCERFPEGDRRYGQ